MQGHRKTIVSISVVFIVLLIGIGVYFGFFHNPIPRLPEEEKDKVEAYYYANWTHQPHRPEWTPLIWYDENGGVEEEFVWRYIGTYGDCYAFLKIGDNENAFFMPVEIPYTIRGLARDVRYPVEANIVLYHNQKIFSFPEVYGGDSSILTKIRMEMLWTIQNRQDWITDDQLEQLTQDIEKIAKEHK